MVPADSQQIPRARCYSGNPTTHMPLSSTTGLSPSPAGHSKPLHLTTTHNKNKQTNNHHTNKAQQSSICQANLQSKNSSTRIKMLASTIQFSHNTPHTPTTNQTSRQSPCRIIKTTHIAASDTQQCTNTQQHIFSITQQSRATTNYNNNTLTHHCL